MYLAAKKLGRYQLPDRPITAMVRDCSRMRRIPETSSTRAIEALAPAGRAPCPTAAGGRRAGVADGRPVESGRHGGWRRRGGLGAAVSNGGGTDFNAYPSGSVAGDSL